MLNVIYLSLLSNRAESFEMEEDLEKIVTGAIDSSITILNEVKALNLNKVDKKKKDNLNFSKKEEMKQKLEKIVKVNTQKTPMLTFDAPTPHLAVLKNHSGFIPNLSLDIPIEKQKKTRVCWTTIVPLNKTELVRGMLHDKIHPRVNVYILDQIIDFIGPADKVAAVKLIVDNIPWTVTHNIKKCEKQGFVRAILEYKRRILGGLCKDTNVDIIIVDLEIIFKGMKGSCEDALIAIETFLGMERIRELQEKY